MFEWSKESIRPINRLSELPVSSWPWPNAWWWWMWAVSSIRWPFPTNITVSSWVSYPFHLIPSSESMSQFEPLLRWWLCMWITYCPMFGHSHNYDHIGQNVADLKKHTDETSSSTDYLEMKRRVDRIVINAYSQEARPWPSNKMYAWPTPAFGLSTSINLFSCVCWASPVASVFWESSSFRR